MRQRPARVNAAVVASTCIFGCWLFVELTATQKWAAEKSPSPPRMLAKAGREKRNRTHDGKEVHTHSHTIHSYHGTWMRVSSVLIAPSSFQSFTVASICLPLNNRWTHRQTKTNKPRCCRSIAPPTSHSNEHDDSSGTDWAKRSDAKHRPSDKEQFHLCFFVVVVVGQMSGQDRKKKK